MRAAATDRSPGEPSRLRRWLYNVGSSYADLITGGIVFFVLTPILVRKLGLEAYGVWIVSQTITFYLAFFDLGLDSAQVRFHANLIARGRLAALRELISTCTVILLAVGALATLLG